MHRLPWRTNDRPCAPTHRLAAALVATLLLAVAAACGSDTETSGDRGDAPTRGDGRTGRNPAGCVEDGAPGEDLFPDTFEIAHAENLSLDYHDTYKVMSVGEPAPDQPARTYVLVQCGTEAPALEGDLAGATVVEVPVRSLYSESTSHLGFIDALGIADLVTGVGNADIVQTPSVRERIDAGEITMFAENYEVDAEQVIAGDPDVYVTSGSDDPAHATLTEADVPVVANAEWMETSPLGWAEWIAFFAALTNTEARAADVYAGVTERYAAAAERVADVAERPTVLAGSLFEGEWNAPGGSGIVAAFIEDAGGRYVFEGDPATGTLVRDIETVLAEGRDAAFWLNPHTFGSREEAVAVDSRYGDFAAWDAGGVWNSSRQAGEAGGNLYTEQGPVKVDVALLDYVKILHPELAEDHELEFFERLPDS